jgi:hypothetical protein
MAIDNPYDQIDQQYPKEAEGVVTALTRTLESANDLGVPFPHGVGGLLAFMNSKTINARLERARAFIDQLVADMQTIQGSVATMRTEMDEVQGAMRISVEYDVDQFNDKKRERYISAITESISSETKVTDLVSFIQDIEKLGERDIIGLKVLNSVMNRKGDWQDPPGPPEINVPRLHPNTFNTRTQELVVTMARALGNANADDTHPFSREEGLQVCLRLQGFGLAHIVSGDTREVPIANYCARPTTRGMMLLRLLGEPVANWNRYFGPDGAL